MFQHTSLLFGSVSRANGPLAVVTWLALVLPLRSFVIFSHVTIEHSLQAETAPATRDGTWHQGAVLVIVMLAQLIAVLCREATVCNLTGKVTLAVVLLRVLVQTHHRDEALDAVGALVRLWTVRDKKISHVLFQNAWQAYLIFDSSDGSTLMVLNGTGGCSTSACSLRSWAQVKLALQ